MTGLDEETLAATHPASEEGETDDATVPGEGSRRGSGSASQGEVIGRYVVLRRLGAGGMGVVFAAYDPELDRKVALKLLHGDPREALRGSRSHRRLLREAQAMAKLSHPNVIAVHDVGEHDGRVYVAMEFVPGKTLGEWLGGDRSWPRVLEVFRQAGRGVAAAHAEGLVHRDFKPDNVMVGDDGRVRVLDFGLARPTADADVAEITAEPGVSPHHDVLHEEVTRAGGIVGTPAYMAPEQHLATEVGPAADQFSFCVALWEALYGQRPFGGDSVAQLAVNVTQGRLREPPRARVPGWLRQALLRGLSVEPERRWASMGVLVDRLERGHARSRRRSLVAGFGAVGLVVLGGVAQQRYAQGQEEQACRAEGARIDEVWNQSTREDLRAGIVATGVSYAPTVAEKVMPWIDAQADEWRDAATTACSHANIDESWSPDTLARAQWCLEDRRQRLEAVVSQMAFADAQAVRNAVQAASSLPPVATCLDEAALAGMGEPPEDGLRPRVAEVRAELARVSYLEKSGKYDEGLEAARQAKDHASEIDWPPLTASAVRARGLLLQRTGAYAEAEADFVDAYMLGSKSGAWYEAASAASSLAYAVGAKLGRHEEGRVWGRHAEVAIVYAGDPLGLLELTRQNNLGNLERDAGDYARASALFETALELAERGLGPKHPFVAGAANNLGDVHQLAGDLDAAQPLHDRALAIWEETLGPNHPKTAVALTSLGNLAKARGDREGAREYYERALSIKEAALGPEHPDVALVLNNAADVVGEAGDYERARELYERARAIWVKTLGPEHFKVGGALNNVATIYKAQGDFERAKATYREAIAVWEKALGPDHAYLGAAVNNLGVLHMTLEEYDEAEALFERALKIWETALGSDHTNVAAALNNLGDIAEKRGDPEQAKPFYERSLAIREKALGPDHVKVAFPLNGLGRVLSKTGEHARALELLERALKIRTEQGASPVIVAGSEFELAEALWAAPARSGGDRRRSLELAQRARQVFADDGEASARNLEVVDEWLASHRL